MQREAAIEVIDELENGMSYIREDNDIWQNRLIYALCQGVRLLLLDAIKRDKK
jgi:hypothetical protein